MLFEKLTHVHKCYEAGIPMFNYTAVIL